MITSLFLPENEVNQYGSWLKEQDPDTLRDYFGIVINAYGIDRLIEKLGSEPHQHAFLVAQQNGIWLGSLHIAKSPHFVEFGVIIKKEYRRQGIANLLLSEAITWAQNRGYQELYMHCIEQNSAIRHLCQKHGLEPTTVHGDVDAKLKLKPISWQSILKELISRQNNLFYIQADYFIRKSLHC